MHEMRVHVDTRQRRELLVVEDVYEVHGVGKQQACRYLEDPLSTAVNVISQSDKFNSYILSRAVKEVSDGDSRVHYWSRADIK
jgi:hypothetical protein